MDDDELRSYFDGDKHLHLRSSFNFVDYDDIDRPIKSFLVNSAEVSLTFGRNKFVDVVLESHEFRDTTTLLQLFAEEDQTLFLNVNKVEQAVSTRPISHGHHIMEIKVMRSIEKKI